jgi:hypothetical protein
MGIYNVKICKKISKARAGAENLEYMWIIPEIITPGLFKTT